jgi:hypothetical protein
METFLDHLAARRARPAVLTHWGSAVIAGKRCFVAGSPCNLIDLVNYLEPLADLLDCRLDVLVLNCPAGGTIAVVLKPPKEERP